MKDENLSKKTASKIYPPHVVVFVAAVFLAFAAGWLLHRPNISEPKITKLTLSSKENYKFVNPLLAVEVSDHPDFKEYKPMEAKIRSVIQDWQEKGDVQDVSVYFRDLGNGRWTGINENETFSPGSLLKVPLMMAYYKLAENNPSLLEKKIPYPGSLDLNVSESIKPGQGLLAGKSYTVDELINRMIVYSDNNATLLLYQNTDPDAVTEIFSDLGITYPQNPDDQEFLTTRQYSLFFRILYNSTFLDPKYSEKALSLLAQSEFKQGIQTGLPENIAVSHKFGEREYADPQTNEIKSLEFHDCGIVYRPSDPYLLCVMTKSQKKGPEELSSLVGQISQLVFYESVKK